MTLEASTTMSRRRSLFATGDRSPGMKEFLENSNGESSSSSNTIMMSAMQGGFQPSFEGYFNIGFSIHVPCDHTMEDCRLEIDKLSQERLESLIMLFLCSQDIEMVISTSPETLLHVCPFNRAAKQSLAMTKTSLNALAEGPGEPLILWNLPKFEEETIAFDDPDETTTVLDMATNKTFARTNGPQQYYTQLNFTYPVYQWGDQDPSVNQVLQEDFDSGVVSSGTLDSLLPFPNAIAAPTGREPYVFWNEPLPGPVRFFDTTIPSDVGVLLRYIGAGLMLANTVVILFLSLSAKLWKRHRERRAKFLASDHQSRISGGSTIHHHQYMDTEAGISAILSESKHYALTKSEAFSRARQSAIAGTAPSPLAATNITSVEVLPGRQGTYETSISPRSAEEKEDLLLAGARAQLQQHTNSTQWFSGNRLLGGGSSALGGSSAYEEDRANETDLQILDLTSPHNGGSSVGENADVAF